MAAVGQTEGRPAERTVFGHPVGLTNLFGVELWERFSFYWMLTILGYYLYYSVTEGGLELPKTTATGIVGAYGGQMASFEWTFSPRGADGRPLPMFDRTTGAVDSAVVDYWKEHYDVAERLRRHWPELRRDLDGRIHLTVGTADNFHLDGAARRLEATMKQLGAKTDFRYVEGRGHFDLYAIGDDPQGLYRKIAWEMYAVARPGVKRP